MPGTAAAQPIQLKTPHEPPTDPSVNQPTVHITRKAAHLPAFVTGNIFRISATSFLDRYTFELKGAKKECVHILTEDGRRMPFSAYNLIHREAHAHAALDPAVARRAGR